MLIGVARGDGTGAFAPAFEEQIGTAAITTLQTFVMGDGGMIAFWVEGTLSQRPAAREDHAGRAGRRTSSASRRSPTAGRGAAPCASR